MKHKVKVFFEEADDKGGAAVLDTMEPPATEVVESPPTEPPTPPAFDPNAFAKQFGESFASTVAKTTPKAEPTTKMTPEEAKKALNVWEPTDEWLTRYDNLETRKAAIAEQRDAMMRQFDTVAQIRLAQLQEQMESKYSPIVTQMQQREATERQNRFASEYPQVSAPELNPLLGAIVQQLQSEGKTFATERDFFKEVAERAASVIKTTNPSFKLSPSVAKPKSSSIPVTTPGASGGGGGGEGGKSKSKSTVLSVLDTLD